ncbi:UTRA domain-containing protein [Pinisolibacter sp.]|uniref:UTRA domain-containing protein n=1 Tax=Pinisolibacter sp. TaxID=2172024 RepID=UPI002FDE94C1
MSDLEDLDGQGPLWQQIRRALIRPMNDGTWPPGTKIPKEIEIMERYGAARMTVHRALRDLAAEGRITRKRRAGTVVAERPPERPLLEIWDIGAEVERLGGAYSFEILASETLDADDPRAAGLGLDEPTPVLRLLVRHFSDGSALQIEERLINLTAVPAAANTSFAGEAPGAWLVRTVPWSEAEHVVSAEEASRETARLLSIRTGTACLVVERRTWNDGEPITWARLVHPGDKRRLVGRFRSESTSRAGIAPGAG